MSHIQVKPKTSLSHHLSHTPPPNPAPLANSLATPSTVPWTTGSVDQAPTPLHWTTAPLLLLPLPPAGLGVLKILSAILLHQVATVVGHLQRLMLWTFTLLTTMLPLPLQLSPPPQRPLWLRPIAIIRMLSATRLCQTGTTARLRLQSTCPHDTAVYLRII